MRLLPLVTGLAFMAVGVLALATGDVTDSWWWIVATVVGSLGVAGLVNAIREGRADTPTR